MGGVATRTAFARACVTSVLKVQRLYRILSIDLMAGAVLRVDLVEGTALADKF